MGRMAFQKGLSVSLADALGMLNIISVILMNLNYFWYPRE